MTRYILALDQGTTSSRAILFDHDGHPDACAQREFRQIFPQPGWIQHDANDIWRSQIAVAQQVMREHGVTAAQIAAIGIANQRETTVLWDRASGEPLANAILWQDRRTAALCEQMSAQGVAPLVQRKTGLVLDAYFSATKLTWLLDHVPGARQRAERGELACGTVDAWLIWKMSGAHITDTSNAARTMLFNIETLDWDDDLLDLMAIPRSLLPSIVPSSGVAAHTRPELFSAALPSAGIAGDPQAATFGQACLQPGMAKNTYGTGCFMLMNVGGLRMILAGWLAGWLAWMRSCRTSFSVTVVAGQPAVIRPLRQANATACVRSDKFSFDRMLLTCDLTVFSLMPSASPSRALLAPAASARSTSISRVLRSANGSIDGCLMRLTASISMRAMTG